MDFGLSATEISLGLDDSDAGALLATTLRDVRDWILACGFMTRAADSVPLCTSSSAMDVVLIVP